MDTYLGVLYTYWYQIWAWHQYFFIFGVSGLRSVQCSHLIFVLLFRPFMIQFGCRIFNDDLRSEIYTKINWTGCCYFSWMSPSSRYCGVFIYLFFFLIKTVPYKLKWKDTDAWLTFLNIVFAFFVILFIISFSWVPMTHFSFFFFPVGFTGCRVDCKFSRRIVLKIGISLTPWRYIRLMGH